GPQQPRALRGELLRGCRREVIDDIPAEDAVDAAARLPESLFEECRELVGTPLARMAFDVSEDVLDEDLASELLAGKCDVAAEDGPQMDEDGRLTRRDRAEEFAQRFGRKGRILGRRHGDRRGHDRLAAARREAIEKAHGGNNREVKRAKSKGKSKGMTSSLLP